MFHTRTAQQGRYRDVVALRGDKLMAVFEKQGYDAVLRELLRVAESAGYGGMYDATVTHAELGQNAAALESLRRMILMHHFMAPFANVAPALQALRDDPHFQHALRAMGL